MAGKGTGHRASDWVWGLQITPTQKLVMLALAQRVDQAYSCFPSLKLIAEETCLNRSTVTRTLNQLEAADLLMRASRQRKNNSATSNRYYLSHPEAPHVTGELDEDDEPHRIAELEQAAARAVAAAQKAALREVS